MGHHIGDEAVSTAWTRANNDLIKRVVDLYPDNFAGVCQLPQSPGVPIAQFRARARALRARAGLRRLQPESRPVGRLLEVAAAHRPPLVPVLREDGRARRAGDGACLGVLQPVLSRDRRALHQRRHHGVHAVHRGRSVPGFPHPEAHHSARRRRGALPLGPLSGARRHAEASAARAARDEERLLRYLRLSSAGHRSAVSRDRPRQHPLRLRDGGRRARNRSRDGLLFRRHQAVHRCAADPAGRQERGFSSRTPAASFRASMRCSGPGANERRGK